MKGIGVNEMKVEENSEYFTNAREALNKQLQAAKAGQDRAFAGEILTGGLLHMLDETKDKYEQLRQRILDETQNDLASYAIRTTIVDRCAYDPTNLTWFPVQNSDLRPCLVDEETVWAAIDQKESVDIRHVFMKVADEDCRKIFCQAQALHGFLETDQGEISARFYLAKSQVYRSEIAALYKLFYANKIPWTTLNTAYLDKFATLRLAQLSDEIPIGAHWRGVRIDYGPYRAIIDEDKIPLWNLQRFRRSAHLFPMPCLDSVNYEHELWLEERDEIGGYLVEPTVDITDIRYGRDQENSRKRMLVVTSRESDAPWSLCKIVAEKPKKSLGYDLPSFSNAARNKNDTGAVCAQPRTKADLERILANLDIADWLQYTGCEFLRLQDLYPDQGDMNWFIQDELCDLNNENILQLNFTALQPEHYLNDAMARFAASSVQRMVSEYRCIGTIGKENTPHGVRQTGGE